MIETERLILRNWKESDLDPFVKMGKDADVMEFFPSTLSEEESRDMARKLNEGIENHGWGLFAVEVKESGAFAGFVGLNRVLFEAVFTPAVEIGWRLAKAYWGMGIGKEAASAVLDFAFDTLQMEKIVSFTSLLNKRSIRLMEAIGMVRVGEFDHPKITKDHRLCRHVLYEKRFLDGANG